MSRAYAQGYESKADRVNSTRAGRRRKKRRREALMIGSLFVLVCVVALLGVSMLLKVSSVEVENPGGVYNNAEIAEASGVKAEESLLRVNKKNVAARICKTLPYVGEAEVQVAFPDTVKISIAYTYARLAVAGPGGFTLLSASGKVLETGRADYPETAALLTGVEITAAVPGETVKLEGENTLSQVTGLTLALEEHGINGVTALDLTDPAGVVAELNGNTDVKLGSISKAAGKLAFGKEVIARTLSQARGTTAKLVIDLTGEDSAYVRSQDDIDQAISQRAATEPPTDINGDPIVTEAPSETAPAEAPTGGAEEPAGAETEEPKGSVG